MTLNQHKKIENNVIKNGLINSRPSLAMSTSVLKALPGKLNIKRHLVFSILMTRPKRKREILTELLSCLRYRHFQMTQLADPESTNIFNVLCCFFISVFHCGPYGLPSRAIGLDPFEKRLDPRGTIASRGGPYPEYF